MNSPGVAIRRRLNLGYPFIAQLEKSNEITDGHTCELVA